MRNKFFIIAAFCTFYSFSFGQQAFYESFDSGSADGVKGKAMVFDGVFTEQSVSHDKLAMTPDFTVEAWIAPQEYASNLAAIVDREVEFKQGFIFGVNPTGKLVAGVAVKDAWISCTSHESVPLLKWSHIALTVENGKAITVFINGKKSGSTILNDLITFCNDCPLSIGKTQTKLTAANTERETSSFVKTYNRFDGLMDELNIHNTVLTEEAIAQKVNATKLAVEQPLQYHKMPSGANLPTKFGAVYTQLKYAPAWDKLWRGSEKPDIVVRFDNSPVRYVFWRGTGYIPAIVNEKDQWMSDQSLEHWGTGECYEAMGDKQARYSHVRLLENTPARVVIHWRYALAGIIHQLFPDDENGWSDWADEYWTIYPDGIAARKQVLWSKRFDTDKGSMQFQETIFFCQPGTRPQDNVEMEAITFLDMKGNKASYNWNDGPPKLKMFSNPKYQSIELVNFKANYKPFSIFDEKRVCQPFSFGNMKEYTTFPNWNHWPVQQVMSDGRNAVAPDKPSHSSLTGSNGKMQIVEKKSEGEYWASSLRGMTDSSIETLMPLAKSWNYAPPASNISVGFTASYDKYQRAYVLKSTSKNPKSILFTVNASEASPVQNLAFVIENFSEPIKKITLNKKTLKPGKDFYVGQVDGLEGTNTVVFVKVVSVNPVVIKVN
ncbi:MAG: hypothetical protein AUK44_03755 [Porphyromonadaceae bacterium CG2_30_38_12]|nr:MAG: hypothetical protein AUK44_03755 [Porphyromonadaceae bacterium CG2_30_38_12]